MSAAVHVTRAASRTPPTPEVLHALLSAKFQFSAFRAPQLEVIQELLAGRDCVLLM